MPLIISIFAILLLTVTSIFAQEIPKSATILETKTVTPKRKMVLWMLDPEKHPFEMEEDDIYTCPDQTRGSYYSGKLKVSLIDATTQKSINTLEVESDDESGRLDIPYAIRPGFYYKAVSRNTHKEVKPEIMALKDYNGDGKAYEFALFDAVACMGLPTTLIGYSEKQDKVIQYPVTVKTPEGTSTQFWMDYLFTKKPGKTGFWNYEIDYRGRGGTLDTFQFRYNTQTESFSGTITRKE